MKTSPLHKRLTLDGYTQKYIILNNTNSVLDTSEEIDWFAFQRTANKFQTEVNVYNLHNDELVCAFRPKFDFQNLNTEANRGSLN